MSFEPASLVVSFIFGSIGFVGFVYGKRMKRLPHMVAGALLMIYPFFIPNVFVMAGIGVALVVLWFLAVRFGA